jgi:2-oxoacid:acceptor oxidoreductase gamma subunit (pyruvate/2-ketoisovalerate family)
MHEIIWHGRGGQGVVVAAQILAEAAYLEGFKGVTSAPTFGPERRGAPLTASTRVSKEPIRIFSQIDRADIVAILDESILKVVNIMGQARPGALIIINTQLTPDHFDFPGSDIATVDAVSIAIKHHLYKESAPVINTPLLGTLVKATEMVSLDNIERALRGKLHKEAVFKNFAAVKAAYEETRIQRAQPKLKKITNG